MAVRFGLVGCGKITERLALPQLLACPDAQVTALVDRDRAAAERLAEQFGLDGRCIWTDWETMLRQAEVDAVGVCVPNHLHRDVTLACCQAKKHVMVEKPIALTLKEADEMVAAARRASVWLMVEQTQRFDPAHEVAKELLDAGAVGRVSSMRGRLGHAGPEYWSQASPWFTTKAESGGGALMDVGVHIIDLLRWLSGKTVARVYAKTATLEKSYEVEDHAVVLLEFTDGAVGVAEANWTTRPYELGTAFYGERGTLTTAYGRATPVVVQRVGTEGDPNTPAESVTPEVPKASRVGGAYPSFVRCILENRRPVCPGEDGRSTLAVVLAAYRSAEEGRWVDVG